MISNRQWITLCLAGVCLGRFAFAQSGGASGGGAGAGAAAGAGSSASGTTPSGTTPSGTGAPSTGTSGAGKAGKAGKSGSAFPTAPGTTGDSTTPANATKPGSEPATPGTTPAEPARSVDPFIPTKPAPKPGESSAFGAPPEKPDSTPGTAPKPETGPLGPSSTFGAGEGGSTVKTPPPSYTLPGFFGGASTTYVGGQGRLARPTFRYQVTVAQGYDDNVLQTPDDPQRAPDQQVLVRAGTPDTVTFTPVTTTSTVGVFKGVKPFDQPVTTTTFVPVVTRGTAPVIRTIRAPDPQERTGSLVSRAGIHVDVQKFSRRSLFTADLNAQIDHYFNRPGSSGKDDYSGSFSMSYLYNLTPRLQTTAIANVAYIVQPDFTRANIPDRLGGGDILNAVVRANLTYRATPRLTVTLAAGENAAYFLNRNQTSTVGRVQNGNSFETTLSAELKYLWKPRYSLLAEFRQVLITYPDASSLDSKTALLLLGGELKLSSRLTASVRLGNAIRIFDESGKSSASPYGEATLSYRLGPTSQIQWTSRYGFDEPLSADSEILTYRTSLSYIKNFTPRLSVSAALIGVLTSNSAKSTGQDFTQQTLDANIALEYHYTRQLTLNATFSFTKVVSTTGDLDYDRSRIFLGAEYEF